MIPVFCIGCGNRVGWLYDEPVEYFVCYCDDCKKQIEGED